MREDVETGKEHHVTAGEGIGLMQLEAKGSQGWMATTRSPEEAREESTQSLRGSTHLLIP